MGDFLKGKWVGSGSSLSYVWVIVAKIETHNDDFDLMDEYGDITIDKVSEHIGYGEKEGWATGPDNLGINFYVKNIFTKKIDAMRQAIQDLFDD